MDKIINMKKRMYKSSSLEILKKLLKEGVLKEYNKVLNIKQNTINKLDNIKLNNYYKTPHRGSINSYYDYSNRIYKWNNNTLINNYNIDNIVKRWFKLLFNSKRYNKSGGKLNSGDMELTKIYSSEPLFLHTNDRLDIYIRILLPKKLNTGNRQLVGGNQKSNKNELNYYNSIINSLIYENNISNNINNKTSLNYISIINILSKIYGKKINIIPIAIKDGGMSEFIVGNKTVYSPERRTEITINKLNKYIVSKSTIIKNSYINKKTLYNILYYSYINNPLSPLRGNSNIYDISNKTNKNELYWLNIMTILPNLSNRYVTGYNLYYAGKLPKADSSARAIKRNTMIGTFQNSNTISDTIYTYNNNGLASTKATIAQL